MKKYIYIFFLAIFSFNANGQIITTIAGGGVVLGDNGASFNANLSLPDKITFDKHLNLYIADALGHRIRKVNASTGIISTYAGNGNGGFAGDNGLAINAMLNTPTGVAVDTFGNIYISDSYNHRIRKVDAVTGIITTIAGSGPVGSTSGSYFGDNGLAVNALLNTPSDIAVDVYGNSYISDYYNYRIRKINAVTGIITTIAGNGTAGYSGDNGQSANSQLNGPIGVNVDLLGNIFISEFGNHVVRKVSTSSIITTVAGNGTAGTLGDGMVATSAQLTSPTGGYVDANNNIYIADDGNHKIRKVNSSGVISTIVGTGTMGFSGDNGPAITAQLRYPFGVVLDTCGNLYIADQSNHRIRKVWLGTTTIPSASITVSPNNTVCAGTTVTFTATPVNAGTTPTYQWLKNNTVIAGATNTTYSYIPTNGDSVQCIVVSSVPCAGPAISNAIHITTTSPTASPTVSIAANPAGAICAGTSVTYTATITNGGSSPSYQWIKNGANTGTNSNIYTYTPNNNDSIRCMLTSSIACTTPVSSNTINMTVNPTVIPTISITANPAGAICPGTSVTYTATVTNGGTSPIYQWKENGANTGANSNTFTYIPNNGDSIRCVLTGNASCASPVIVSSNSIIMTVTPAVIPTLSISVSPSDTLCADSIATFTATATNAGSNPSYQWLKNGSNTGTNSITYNYLPNNGDSIRCVLSSNSPCAVPAIVSSNSIHMIVNPNITATVAITGNTNVQTGVPTTYTAVTNVTGATYQWQVNGVNAGTNSSTFIYTPGTDSVVIACYVTVPANSCASPSFVTTKITVHIATAGITATQLQAVQIYPNPANNELHIDNITQATSYQLQNIVGQSILQGTFTQQNNTIQLQALPAGMYLLQLTDDTIGKAIIRIIKK